MVMVNIKDKPTGPSVLNLNTARWLFPDDTYSATKYLSLYEIPFRIILSGEGYWVNVTWKCGITAPLTYQEIEQLPHYLTFHPKPRN